MTYREMAALARSLLNPKEYGEFFSAGFVAAVLAGANGKYYTGVNIDLACGLGFCAERGAAAANLSASFRPKMKTRNFCCARNRCGRSSSPSCSLRPGRNSENSGRLPFAADAAKTEVLCKITTRRPKK